MAADEYSEDRRVNLREVRPTTWRRLRGYLHPQRLPLAGAVGLTILATLSELAGPFLIQQAIDGPMADGDAQGLIILFVIYVAMYGINWGASYLQTFLTAKIGQDVIYAVREDLFAHVQGLSMRFFEQRSIGRILSRMTNDVQAINRMVTNSITTFFSQTVILVAVAGIMLYMNVELALISFIVVPVAAVVVVVIGRQLRLAYHRVRRRIADVNAMLEENISGVREVQALQRERRNKEAFEDLNEENFEANLRAGILASVFWPAVDLLSVVGTVIVLWFGGWMVFAGTLQVGELVAFLLYIERFYWPVRQLSEVINTVQSALASAERISQYMDEEPEVEEASNPLSLPQAVTGEVVFDGVDFGYEPEEQVLFDVSFRVAPGETIAIVGPTGAGKTTIVSLMARFYDPWRGEVRLDGVPIHRVPLRELRRKMALVLQDNVLFAGSVTDNVRFGRPDATDEEVEAACRLVHAHTFIEELPEGYATEVREGGRRLSAGQRQLLAYARALVADPPVLILDEATSEIDLYTEALIQEATARVIAERTAVIIAHRLATIRRADRILVVADGRIAEEGPHRELLQRGGLYARLYRTQMRVETGQISEADAATS